MTQTTGGREPDSAADEIVMPGFRGRVVARLAGLLVVEGVLEGELPAHAATADELAVVLSGRVEVALSGHCRTLEAGEHLVVPAGMVHGVRASAPARLLLLGAAE